jgi:hypothetical protein
MMTMSFDGGQDGDEAVDVNRLDPLNTKARTRRERRDARWAFVYFIQVVPDGPIKIGCAHDVIARLIDLQIGNHCELRLLTTMWGGSNQEAALHRRFAEHSRRGEWFHPAPELLAFIAALPPMPPPPRGSGA